MAKIWDAIVVGSGFGGAVAAARLAERGLQVLILERGPWWGPAGADQAETVRREFPRGARLPKLLRNVRRPRHRGRGEWLANVDGLFEIHDFSDLTVFTGSGVGGGSLVYTNMQVQPSADYFAAWPAELRGGEMDVYYDRVRQMLRPAPQMSETAKLSLFRQAANGQKIVLPDLAIAQGDPERPRALLNTAGVEQQTCNHCGECIIGCNHKAKTTLDLTYIPWALKHGACLQPLAEVQRLEVSGEGYQIYFQDHIDGYLRSAKARRVYLAAGTLNSLRLLLRAKHRDRTLPSLSTQLGQRFCGNGDMGTLILGARAGKADTRGPSVGGYVAYQDVAGYSHLVAEGGLPGMAFPANFLYKPLLDRSYFLLAMGRDQPSGVVSLVGGGIDVAYGRGHSQARYDAIESASLALAQGYRARKVLANMPHGAGSNRLASVHPTGGAAAADSAATGVVDHGGQVFGYRGLYVVDGSVYPAPPGIPPSMTIAAFAERVAALTQ